MRNIFSMKTRGKSSRIRWIHFSGIFSGLTTLNGSNQFRIENVCLSLRVSAATFCSQTAQSPLATGPLVVEIAVNTTHCYHWQINGWDSVCYVLTRWMKTDEWLSDGNVCWEFQAFSIGMLQMISHWKWLERQWARNINLRRMCFHVQKDVATTMAKKCDGVIAIVNVELAIRGKRDKLDNCADEFHSVQIFQIEIDNTQLSIHKWDCMFIFFFP